MLRSLRFFRSCLINPLKPLSYGLGVHASVSMSANDAIALCEKNKMYYRRIVLRSLSEAADPFPSRAHVTRLGSGRDEISVFFSRVGRRFNKKLVEKALPVIGRERMIKIVASSGSELKDRIRLGYLQATQLNTQGGSAASNNGLNERKSANAGKAGGGESGRVATAAK